jgi:hypothetical protein
MIPAPGHERSRSPDDTTSMSTLGQTTFANPRPDTMPNRMTRGLWLYVWRAAALLAAGLILAELRKRRSRWLSSMAWRERSARGGPSHLTAAVRAGWRMSRGAWLHRFAFLWLVPALVVPVVFFPRFRMLDRWADDEAGRFVSTLWQVDATVLALSVAVIVLALQVFSTNADRPLTRSVQESGLLPTLYVGIATLFVTGLTLMNVGIGAPGGGAGSWAALVSGFEWVLLAALYARATRAIDWGEITKVRGRRNRRAVAAYVDKQALHRFAVVILQQQCSALGVRLQMFIGGRIEPNSIPIRARRVGEVRDINIGILRKIARTVAQTAPTGWVELRARPGQRVGPQSILLVLAPGTSPRVRRSAERVVKL